MSSFKTLDDIGDVSGKRVLVREDLNVPMAWKRLGSDLPLDKLDSTVSEAGLGDLLGLAPKILKGEIRGRVVVDVSK